MNQSKDKKEDDGYDIPTPKDEEPPTPIEEPKTEIPVKEPEPEKPKQIV